MPSLSQFVVRASRRVVGGLAPVLLVAGAVGAQNLVVNGSFESPAIAGTTKGFLAGNVFGWTVTVASNVPGIYKDGAFGYGNTTDGLQAWDLGIGGVGYGNTISQTLPTVAGQRYILTFDWGSEFDRGTHGRVTIGDLEELLVDQPFDQSGTYSAWIEHAARFAFTADGQDLLTFADLTDATTATGPASVGGGLSLDQIVVSLDGDGDGLTDDEEAGLGTNPAAPDSDLDGLLDGTEVDMAQGGSCPDPLDADSDGDTLADGLEVEPSLGTDPCNADTDGDLVPDGIDDLPTVPGVTSGFIEDNLRSLCEFVNSLSLDNFVAPNDNARKGRRNAMCNKLNAAAGAVAQGDDQDAYDQLVSLLQKLDDEGGPPDWMVHVGTGDGKTFIASDIAQMAALISLAM